MNNFFFITSLSNIIGAAGVVAYGQTLDNVFSTLLVYLMYFGLMFVPAMVIQLIGTIKALIAWRRGQPLTGYRLCTASFFAFSGFALALSLA